MAVLQKQQRQQVKLKEMELAGGVELLADQKEKKVNRLPAAALGCTFLHPEQEWKVTQSRTFKNLLQAF